MTKTNNDNKYKLMLFEGFVIAHRQFPCLIPLSSSGQDGDAAVRHGACRQQRSLEVLRDGVQHGAGVRLVKQQRLTRPVEQDADPLGSPHHLQGHFLPGVTVRVDVVVARQHPGLGVVAQSGLVTTTFALQRGVADPDLEGGTLTHVYHPAVGAGGHGQGAQSVGPRVEAGGVVGRRVAGLLLEEGQSSQVVGEGEEGAHCALVKL